jgi:hypothetical protein
MPRPINTLLELGAYESLWMEKNASVETLAECFAGGSALPSVKCTTVYAALAARGGLR